MGNSEQKKENNKPKEDENSNFIRKLFWGAISVFIGVTLLFFYINNWAFPTVNVTSNNDSSNTLSNLGTIGDYFGGLINPLLGFVSFCALLYTIRIQMKSLEKQSEELELTREELRATKEELARSAKAQEKSSKIFRQQQFENTFFSLLNQIILSIENFHKNHIVKKKSKMEDICNNKNILTIKDEFDAYDIIREISGSNTLKNAWGKINSYDSSLPKIFILIYQLLKLIRKYERELFWNEAMGGGSRNAAHREIHEIAKSYSNIFRSCLDSDFLQLFAINGCRDDFNNMRIYKKYIQKYALLEHMSFKFRNDSSVSEILKEMTNIYSEDAFGNSDAYRELKNSQQQTS